MSIDKSAPTIWAVGGGKGGIGKSVVSTLIAHWLSASGKRTVLVDMDLGGANVHTLMGIRNPSRTLNDFVSKKARTLDEVCIETEEENLRLIAGAGEILSLANPKFAQKVKIIRGIYALNAQHVILDLGAGTSFNILDFFLMAQKQIAVVTPQPTSIQNAYAFLRSAVYRRLSQLSSRDPSLNTLIQTAMNPKNELQMRTIKELCQVIEELEGTDAAMTLQKNISEIRPAIVTNMIRDPSDRNASRIVQLVAEKYLTIPADILGGISYDRQVDQMILEMAPLIRIARSSAILADIHDLVTRMML